MATIDDQARALALSIVKNDARITGGSGGAYVNVKDATYGARGDGATDDTSAIQAAINAANSAGGGTVLFPRGDFRSKKLTTYSNVHLRGVGIQATILRLADSQTTSLLQGNSFSTLTGTNGSGGINSWSIADMTIDGNKSGSPSGGRGIEVFGYGYYLRDVRVRNCKSDGIWTEWGTSAGTPGPDGMEAHYSGLMVHECDGSGLVMGGPHDSTMVNCHLYENALRGLWVRPNGASFQMANVHSWGNNQDWAYFFEGGDCKMTGCVGEGATAGQVFVGANDVSIIGGDYYNAGGGLGIQIGDATHPTITGTHIDTKLMGFASGQYLVFTSDGGTRARVLAYGGAGTVHSGTPNSRSQLDFATQGGVLGPSDPTLLTLASGWANYDSANYTSAGYRRAGNNTVYLQGAVTHATALTLPSLITTLPAGFRPFKRQSFPVSVGNNPGGAVMAAGVVDILGTGEVYAVWCSNTAAVTNPSAWNWSLNGISFLYE